MYRSISNGHPPRPRFGGSAVMPLRGPPDGMGTYLAEPLKARNLPRRPHRYKIQARTCSLGPAAPHPESSLSFSDPFAPIDGHQGALVTKPNREYRSGRRRRHTAIIDAPAGHTAEKPWTLRSRRYTCCIPHLGIPRSRATPGTMPHCGLTRLCQCPQRS